MAWKDPTGLPNCWRILSYSTVSVSALRAMPARSPATRTAARSRTSCSTSGEEFSSRSPGAPSSWTRASLVVRSSGSCGVMVSPAPLGSTRCSPPSWVATTSRSATSAYSTSPRSPVSVGPDDGSGAPAGLGVAPLRTSATAALSSPTDSRGRCSACCAGEPASRRASPATTVDSQGPGTVAAPKARAMTEASSRPSPRPSCSSGTSTASQPCSLQARHRSAGTPSESVSNRARTATGPNRSRR